jgi:hypothetical protein
MGPPDVKIDVNTGFRYPCSQEDIDDLQDRTSLPRNHGDELVNVYTAVEELKDSLQGYRGYDHITKAALVRLRGLEEDFPSLITYPDMVLKIFHDLDLILFDKSLAGNVYLRVKCGMAGTYGDCCPRGKWSKRVCITINSHNFVYPLDRNGKRIPGKPRSTYKDLILTLIHEMIHAFLLVVCGFLEEEKADKEHEERVRKNRQPGTIPNGNHDQAHGIGFQLVMKVVQGRLNKMGRPWNEIDVTQNGRYLVDC